ncbi:MAG: hypothetical protein ACFFCI_15080 [Promethearchaeota archaeon]
MRRTVLVGFVLIVLVVCFIPGVIQPGRPQFENDLKIASNSNSGNIDSILAKKIDEYDNYGYFPQLYEPSLQAIYYGLSILYALGKLERVNATMITEFIMAQYNASSHLFIDTNAYRYLDTDFSHDYYPLSSLLEANCYALLSLNLLGKLNLIDVQNSIEFIWSCYNPVSSGFVGQPYNSQLHPYFRISTMDNTYFALKALDLLLTNWLPYDQERDDIVNYINSLQITENIDWRFGGFMNDNSSLFDSLEFLYEPNLISSYYCLKSLEILNLLDTIDLDNFYQFLAALYSPKSGNFQISLYFNNNFTNIVATSLGLELSDLTGFPSYDKNKVIDFIYKSRNSLGIWDRSTVFHYHELIDTFQVIRSVKNSGGVARFTLTDITQIVDNVLDYFLMPKGFSLYSQDYSTITLIHNVISAFDLWGRIPELNIQNLYSAIKNVYYVRDSFGINTFYSLININMNYLVPFRTYPIEFYSAGYKTHIDEIGYLYSHRSTYEALDSLRKIYKLDDFALQYNLNKLVDNIIDSQFLNSSYPEFHGGFMPFRKFNSHYAEIFKKNMFFEYSYYAIKALSLLAEFLDIGDISFLNFDIDAFKAYIDNHIVEDSEVLYYAPSYTDDFNIILQNTYYMVEVLKILDLYNLNTQKIENLIESNIDYTNIKNVYYSYKLADILNLDFTIDAKSVQKLVRTIYSENKKEFYSTTDRSILNQEILLWVCDMARNDKLKIDAKYQEGVMLGRDLSITASLYNIICTSFEYNLTFIFESPNLGIHLFDKRNENNFTTTVFVKQSPQNHPVITGKLIAYDNGVKLAEKSISINTFYPEKVYQDEINGTITVSVLLLTIPGVVITVSEKKLRKATSGN